MKSSRRWDEVLVAGGARDTDITIASCRPVNQGPAPAVANVRILDGKYVVLVREAGNGDPYDQEFSLLVYRP